MLTKNRLFLIFFYFVSQISLIAQEEIPTSCTNPNFAFKENKKFYEAHKDQIQKKVKKFPGTNTRAYTQSIHNVIARWDSGSYYRFEIGTSPGSNDINRGHLLRNTDLHTGGHSYEELRKTALDQGTNFSIGDTFYISLYDTNTATPFWVSPPLVFQWDTLGDPSYEVNIVVETNYGDNGAPPYTAVERDKMMAFYNLVNPIIKEVYGPPSRNHDVYIVNDANAVGTNTFYNGPNQISSSFELNRDGDLDQPRLMIHEIVHAYRDNLTVSSDDEWHYDTTLSGFEEGMAESVAVIVMDIFIERYPNFFNGDEFKIHWSHARGMRFDWDYDFQNHPQLTTTDFFSSDIGTGAHWERYGTSQAAMQKIYVEDPDIFKKFNKEYYDRLNANNFLTTSRNLMLDIFGSIITEVERTPILDWINQQRVLDCKVVPGDKVHMLTFHSASPPRIHTLDNRIHAVQTQNTPNGDEWSWDVIDNMNPANSKRWYIQTNNLDGQLEIYNYDNTLASSTPITNDKRRRSAGEAPDLGPYQGPNNMRTNGVFTGNEDATECTNQPGCGKRPETIENHSFRATSAANRTHRDLPTNLPDPNSQIIPGLSELGLYRYDISFEASRYQGTYYRLHGNELVQLDGILGGIKSNDDTNLITGKLIIEHENYNEEQEIPITNGGFVATRDWAGVLETDNNRQGGRTDRRYSVPGKVHSIFISEDCAERKIDFRNIRYGDGLSGCQLFLFTVEDFEDIEFKTEDIAVCQGNDVVLTVTNNFPDILDGDSRITYQWLDPSGTEISTNFSHTITNANQAAHQGTYTLNINFFGCPIPFESEVTINDSGFDVITPTEITLCDQQILSLETNQVTGATYSWSGPNGFTANTREIVIDPINPGQAGIYTVSVTAQDCKNQSATQSSATNVIVTPAITLSLTTTDMSVCANQPVTLTVNDIANTSYNWSGPNGFSANTRETTLNPVTMAQEGIYTVTATTTDCNGTLITDSSSITLTVTNDDFDVTTPSDLILCEQQNLVLEANLIQGATYAWIGPNGFTANTRQITRNNITNTDEGAYIVTVTAPNCNNIAVSKTDSTNVTITSDINLSLITTDIPACDGDDITLTVNLFPNTTYEWIGPNGFTARGREVTIAGVTQNETGIYTVTARSKNCSGADIEESETLLVSVENDITIDLTDIPSEVSLCNGDDFLQVVPFSSNTTYLWTGPNGFVSDESDINIKDMSVSDQGIYTLTVILDTCKNQIEESKSINVTVDNCINEINIPNFFTPNGDGFNDSWIINTDNFSFKAIYIFDRYGKLLKQLSPNNNSWDGTYRGKPMPSTDYWYTVNHQDDHISRGHFSLIR